MTPYQHKLCKLRLDGFDLNEIAQMQKVTRKAIEYHFTRIYRELGIQKTLFFQKAYEAYREKENSRHWC